MVDLVNKIELRDHNYQNNGAVRDKILGKVLIYYEGIYVIWNILSVNILYINHILKR